MLTSSTLPNGIVFFHYYTSPYARRVVWYLAFRNIAYAECIQPRIMPRPDLAALGVRYRKTPTMAIGRDVYVDSRTIIARLEQLYPPSADHPAFSTKETAGLAGLLNKLNIDIGIFMLGVRSFPANLPIFNDPDFMRDRSEYFGKDWNAEETAKTRPQALVHMRHCFDILEALLVGGKKWIGGTDKPTLADLEGVWVIDWLLSSPWPQKEYFSEEIYPNIYEWQTRFRQAVDDAIARAPKPVQLQGSDAVAAILSSEFSDEELTVDSHDPIQLAAGTRVEVYPTDGGGFMEKDRDRGRLIKLTKDEVAIAVRPEEGDKELHLHAPRWNFAVRETNKSSL